MPFGAEYEKEERVEILTTFYATYDPSKSVTAIRELVEKAKRALLSRALHLSSVAFSLSQNAMVCWLVGSGEVPEAVSPTLREVYAPFKTSSLSS